MRSLSLPHLRRYRPTLGQIWLGLIVGLWSVAYLMLKAACAAYHAIAGLF